MLVALFSNEPEITCCLHTVKWFQVLPSNTKERLKRGFIRKTEKEKEREKWEKTKDKEIFRDNERERERERERVKEIEKGRFVENK